MGKSDKNEGFGGQGTGGGARVQGTIKRLVQDKGFGFIKDEGSATEYFFHQSGLMSGTDFHELVEGDRVEFTAGKGPKGPRAEAIRIAPID